MVCIRTSWLFRLGGALLLVLVALSSLFVAPPLVQAQATLVVTKGADTDDGTCDTDCSLREAITVANAGVNPDTITFASGVTTATLTLGQLTISTTLTIEGGLNGVGVARSGTAPAFRVFNITAGTVNLNGLTIQGGSATGNLPASEGGGIRNEAGRVTVTNSTISGNGATNGAGISNATGTVTVTNSIISNNGAFFGGGISNNGTGTVTVTNSTISSNTANAGGGIANGGTLEVTNSTLNGNSASSFGGGIFNSNAGTVQVTSSTLSGNGANLTGGGVFNEGTVTVTNSTFSGNTSANGGGGIENGNEGTLTVTNSTLSGNSGSSVGGILNRNTLTLANTIVANSTGSVDYFGNAPTVLGVNIVETGLPPNGTTIINDDPQLGPLQNNGGLTLTHLPQPTSPAINRGFNAVALDPGGNPLTTDQRGFVRITAGTVDIGAVELSLGNINYEVTVAPISVSEGDSGVISATVTITRSGAITVTSSVGGVLSGTATLGIDGTVLGTDYTVVPTSSGVNFDLQRGVLTFNPGIAQATATVTVIGDNLAESDETAIVTLVNATPPVGGSTSATLTIINDDTASVPISPSEDSTTVAEGGGSDTYTVVLTSQPTALVTINITPDAQLSTDVTSLTFTPTNWATPQTVTVSAVDDTVVEGAHTGTISHSASSSDSNYNGITIANVSVSITDNDRTPSVNTVVYVPLIAR